MKKLVFGLLTDVGFTLTASTFFLFAGTTLPGLVAVSIALAAITAVKSIQIVDPPFLKKNTRLSRLIQDERTTLYLLGVCEATVMAGALLVNGLTVAASVATVGQFVSTAWQSVITPALSAGSYAAADFILAAQISRAKKLQNSGSEDSRGKDKVSVREFLSLSARQPEPYLAFGAMTAGLMAGVEAVLAFPFILAAAAITLDNVIHNHPEHHHHPKLLYLIDGSIVGAVAVLNGHYLMAASGFTYGPSLALAETKITPGGTKQVAQDVKNFFTKNLASAFGRSAAPPPSKSSAATTSTRPSEAKSDGPGGVPPGGH